MSFSVDQLPGLLQALPRELSLAHVARLAGMSHSHLVQIRLGRIKAVTPTTAGRVRLALRRIKARTTEGPAVHVSLFRAVLSLVALDLELDLDEVHRHDPTRKQVFNPQWMACSKAHWMARYLMNTGCGVSVTDVGRICGVTKQAVSMSLQEVELMRDDPAFDARLVALEQRVIGG